MDTFSNRLREERQRLGLNQTEFAEVAGVQKRAQVNYEAGERSPDSNYMAAIAAAGVDVLYVITGQRNGGYVPPPVLKPDEAALVDNYRHSPASEQALLRQTSAAFARSAGRKSA